MAAKDFQRLLKEAQDKRLVITRQQRLKIAHVYRDAAHRYGREIARSGRSMSAVKAYAKEMRRQQRHMVEELTAVITSGVKETSDAVLEAHISYYTSLSPALRRQLRDRMSTVPQYVVDELMHGGIYKDGAGISKRLWKITDKYGHDIEYIISRGIVENRSALEITRDLELFLKPGTEKPFEWSKVYPHASDKVDFSAQRLARTSVTHAYQLANERSCEENPFVTGWEWRSSNSGRVCPECRARNGMIYAKGNVPLDHPLGMCVILPVIEKTPEEIASELTAWANGAKNPALDRWLGEKD